MFQNMYTPEEVARMKAQLEQNYQNGALQNQNLNTAASMAKNLNPMANLGMLAGTLVGKWGAQRLNDIFDKEVWRNRIQGSANPENWSNPLEGKYQPKYHGAGLPEGGVYANQIPQYFPDSRFYTTPNQFKYNPSLNPAPSTALNPPTTNFVPNNAAPSTALFTNNTPYFDWRNQNYLTHQVTRPQYLSIR